MRASHTPQSQIEGAYETYMLQRCCHCLVHLLRTFGGSYACLGVGRLVAGLKKFKKTHGINLSNIENR